MQNYTRHLSQSIYRLSIAIVFGVACNAKSAPAAEHLNVSLGAYTVYQSGVSDQVPVSVKLQWPSHTDTVNIYYTAYDSSVPAIQVLNSSKQISMNNGQTFNDTVVVPTGPTLPVHF